MNIDIVWDSELGPELIYSIKGGNPMPKDSHYTMVVKEKLNSEEKSRKPQMKSENEIECKKRVLKYE